MDDLTPDVDEQSAVPLLDAARGLRDLAHRLGDHPDKVDPLVRDIEAALLTVSFFLHDASRAVTQEASTAVALFSSERGLAQASYAAAMLESASNALQHARQSLMSATAQTGDLLWPEHDPVAAEQLDRYRDAFEHRADQVTADDAAPDQHTTVQPEAPER